jgi:hypothetical protein
MDIGKVFIDEITIGQRHRALDADKVEGLAESIDAIGLQQPISVYVDAENATHLVAGLHRLEAVKKLGWEMVEASFVKLSPTRREMWEIAENLFRVDLSKEQRDEHLKRYAVLIEEVEAEEAAAKLAARAATVDYQNDKQPAKSKGGRPKSITTKVAEATGVSYQIAHRALYQPAPKPAPEPISDEDAREKQVAALMAAWNKASAEARQDFLDRIEVN